MIRLNAALSVVCVLGGLVSSLTTAAALARGDLLGALLLGIATYAAFSASTDFARLAAWAQRDGPEHWQNQ